MSCIAYLTDYTATITTHPHPGDLRPITYTLTTT